MDGSRFDALAKSLSTQPTRRGVLKVLAGIALGSVAATLRTEQVAAACPAAGCPDGKRCCAVNSKVLQNGTCVPICPYPQATATNVCARQTYTNTRFTGAALVADVKFFNSLDKINQCAAAKGVYVSTTSSFRTTAKNDAVCGACKSPHLIGHAIDMNVIYGANRTCDWTCLEKHRSGTAPAPVANFLTCVTNAGLRWGGTFSKPDPVHLDDNPGTGANFAQRYQEVQSRQGCGGIKTCKECRGGQCVPMQCDACKECKDGVGCVPVDCGDPCLACVDNSCRPKQCGACEDCLAGVGCIRVDGCCDPPCGACSKCENGECVPTVTCPAGRNLNPKTCQCDCPEGTVLDGSLDQCVPCPSDSPVECRRYCCPDRWTCCAPGDPVRPDGQRCCAPGNHCCSGPDGFHICCLSGATCQPDGTCVFL